MSPGTAFVVAQQVGVAYQPRASLIHRLTGKKALPHPVVHDVSFTLELGDRVTLFGAAAAGKSTLLRLMTGALAPTAGSIRINGQAPSEVRHLAAGYVSSDEREPSHEIVSESIQAFATTHRIANLPARLGAITDTLGLDALLPRPAHTLSSSERLRLNLARAALSDSPLILLDEVATELGIPFTQMVIEQLFADRTVVIATRQSAVADGLTYPLLIIEGGRLIERGPRDDLAQRLACPQIVDVWMEGIQYDVLRQLKAYAGVLEASLMPSLDFRGQRLRLTVRSRRHLPAVYDVVGRHPIIRIDEQPVPLEAILERLRHSSTL